MATCTAKAKAKAKSKRRAGRPGRGALPLFLPSPAV